MLKAAMIARIRIFFFQKYAPEPLRCLITIRRSTYTSYQIISTEEGLVKAARTLRSIRNKFAPVNKLPPEVLAHVCTFAPEVTSDFAHTCAQVCRFWRNTLVASPSLWNEIRTEDPLHVDVHLARSGEVPLEVYFRRGSPVGRFCQKVVPHMDRVRLLYLSLSADDCEQILDSLETGREMVLLREFHFKKGSTRLRLSAQMMEKISSFAANITILGLLNVDTHLPSLTFPRLLYFSLITDYQRGFKGPRVSDLIGFLRGHPTLEAFNLHRASYSHMDDAGTHIEPIALRYLKSAILGGKPSPPSPSSLPYIKVDLLPYLHLPPVGRCSISITPFNVKFPRGTNNLLTLIRAWESVPGRGGGFGGDAGFTSVDISVKEGPSMFAGRLKLEIAGRCNLHIGTLGPGNVSADSQPSIIPDWETVTTDEDPGTGDVSGDEIQTQLSRLGCYLDPLRWSPSPLAAVEALLFCGFGYTTNKRKYLQYLRECFGGLGRIRKLQVEETNPWMIVHLLRPFEDESGGVVLVFPLLKFLSFDKCTPAELPQPTFLGVVKERAALGNVLEAVLVGGKTVDLSELLDTGENV